MQNILSSADVERMIADSLSENSVSQQPTSPPLPASVESTPTPAIATETQLEIVSPTAFEASNPIVVAELSTAIPPTASTLVKAHLPADPSQEQPLPPRPALPAEKAEVPAQNTEILSVIDAALVRAVMEGRTVSIRALIEKGADIRVRLPDGWNLLMLAAWNGHVEIMELLLKHDMFVDAKDEKGRTALMAAVWSGQVAAVQSLAVQGASVDSKDDDGKTVLMWAAQKGNVKIVDFLVKQGANINIHSPKRMTALRYAQREGHEEVLKILRMYGAQECISSVRPELQRTDFR